MNTIMDEFEAIMATAHRNATSRRQQESIRGLVALIDELSGEMGSGHFRDAVRLHGYDIDACSATLGRRGLEIN